MSQGKKAIFYALAANLGIALAKTGAALFTGSGAMAAEAIHSFADCANQGLLLIGLRDAGRGRSPRHPMGTGRATYFWSLLVAVLLFFVGGAFSLFEGIERLLHPTPLQMPGLALGILGFSVALESFSLYGALKESRAERAGRSLWQWFRETRQPELLVVTGEDVAALGGLALAFGCVGLAMLTGNPAFDALGSCLVGLLLMLIALALSRELRGLVIGESLPGEEEATLRAFILAQPEVKSLMDLIALQHGSEWMLAIRAEMQVDQGVAEAINRVEARIQERWPQARWVFFEPDVEGNPPGSRNLETAPGEKV